MMNAKELQEIKENSFDKWFERWWKKSNLPEKLKQSAMQGHSGYKLVLDDDYYTIRRMRDSRFVEKLKDQLPDLDINYQKEITTHKNILGMTWDKATEYISISWSDEDES